MTGEISLEQGRYLVELARESAESFIASGKKTPPGRKDGVLGEKRGVFVTVEKFPSMNLRGCIGYPLPLKPLADAVVDNAIAATNEDPRFLPLEKGEFAKVVFEVSVLTVPEKVVARSPEDYPKKIKVGRDGLIVRMGYAGGLLLPQVAVEWGWDSKEFLSAACEKAGLPPEMWHSKSVLIEKFSAQIFCEKTPRGAVIEKKLVSAR